jgi:hypothetical protein
MRLWCCSFVFSLLCAHAHLTMHVQLYALHTTVSLTSAHWDEAFASMRDKNFVGTWCSCDVLFWCCLSCNPEHSRDQYICNSVPTEIVSAHARDGGGRLGDLYVGHRCGVANVGSNFTLDRFIMVQTHACFCQSFGVTYPCLC